MTKNINAARLGSLGGSRNTEAQKLKRLENLANGREKLRLQRLADKAKSTIDTLSA